LDDDFVARIIKVEVGFISRSHNPYRDLIILDIPKTEAGRDVFDSLLPGKDICREPAL